MATARKTSSPSKSTKAAKSVPAKPVKIALLGFGTVGGSVAKVLAASKFAGIEREVCVGFGRLDGGVQRHSQL
jgi:hypothetical protein